MTRFWLSAAVILLAATLLACGGDKDGASTSSGATGSTAAGRKLSDCDYADALLRSLETFTDSLPSFGAFQSKEDAITAFDTFDSALGTLIDEMKSYQLSADVATVNSGVVAIFEDARKQIPELKSAAESGDTARLTAAGARISQQVVPRMDTIQQENQEAIEKLNSCEGV